MHLRLRRPDPGRRRPTITNGTASTMTSPPQRNRARVRRPTLEHLSTLAAAELLHPSDAELVALGSHLDRMYEAVDRVEELRPPEPVLRHLTRDPGRAPTTAEDALNSFTRICHVEGSASGPLAGLRVAVSDSIAIAGVPVSNASTTLAFTPTFDAIVVERLLDAGAHVVGKTNLGDYSVTQVWGGNFGPVRNCRDTARSAGASSSGAASAVGSGLADIGLGADLGGSARISAGFNGVVAVRASQGRVPTHGATHVDHTIDALCPITPDVAGAAAALDAISGADDRDPQWMRERLPRTDAVGALDRGVEGRRIAVVAEGLIGDGLETAVRDAFEASCDRLRDAGAIIEQVTMPLWADAWAIHQTMMFHFLWVACRTSGGGYTTLGELDPMRMHSAGVVRSAETDEFPIMVKTNLLGGADLVSRYHSRYFARAAALRTALRRQFDDVFSHVDLIVSPTTPGVAPELVVGTLDDVEMVDRARRIVENTSASGLAGLPTIAVPNGEDGTNGMPTSFQIIAPHGHDESLFPAAQIVEALGRRLGGVMSEPPVAPHASSPVPGRLRIVD